MIINLTKAGGFQLRLLYILLAILVTGCASVRTEVQEVYSDKLISVNLIQERKKTGEIVPKGYQHPWETDSKTLDLLLKGIKYKKGGLFKKNKLVEVFPDEDRKALLSPLQKAFEQANPDQVVDFSFIHRKKWMIFKRDFLTDGLLFCKGRQLNCAFRNIALQEMAEGGYDAYEGDPRHKAPHASWNLVPGKGQRLAKADKERLFGSDEYTHWIVLSLAEITLEEEKDPEEQLPIQAEKSIEPGVEGKSASEESLPQNREEIEKRLQFLDELYQEGALSPVAYEEKKRALEKLHESLPPGVEQ